MILILLFIDTDEQETHEKVCLQIYAISIFTPLGMLNDSHKRCARDSGRCRDMSRLSVLRKWLD